jgi:hypothetical protein
MSSYYIYLPLSKTLQTELFFPCRSPRSARIALRAALIATLLVSQLLLCRFLIRPESSRFHMIKLLLFELFVSVFCMLMQPALLHTLGFALRMCLPEVYHSISLVFDFRRNFVAEYIIICSLRECIKQNSSNCGL